ncbi:MAG TPA: DUF427 domain-containing protein [Gemmatimonadales bacterium]|nr:DUF427 domain-containing protein [Gemmatimonadales bacterium]
MTEPLDPHRKERDRWRDLVRTRPPDIVRPGPGQESVWDYPRPPRVDRVIERVRVEFEGRRLADTVKALRVCETSSPPAYYIPQADIEMRYLEPTDRSSFCEWKGEASYWSVNVGSREVKDAAWSYSQPDPGFEAIRDHIAFYPRRMDACWVGEARVLPQPGFFYGGWVTPELVGPFKGVPGSQGW